MKRTGAFEWTPEANAAFKDLKHYLASLPIMVAPQACEPLLLYLAATAHTASVVLVAEREEPVPAVEDSPAPPGLEPSDKNSPAVARGLSAKEPPQAGPQE